jgi:hypothetical protein
MSMKRFALAASITLALCAIAYAAIRVPAVIVTPPETGEWDAMQQQVVDVARLKPGMCTVTTGGSEAAQTGTCNGAAGVVTSGFNITVVSNAKDTVTLTNNKVQVGDMCIAMIDDTGAAAASVPEITSCKVSAGQLILTVSNASATSAAAALKYYFLVLTQGNIGN